jgi:hypothetical protein
MESVLELIVPLVFGATVAGVILFIIKLSKKNVPTKPLDAQAPLSAKPIGRTAGGQPIYPIVGYTPDGNPVTADRAVGVLPANPRTNPLAIVALVLGFVFPLIAIPVGHVSRSQIRRTGEQGDGMALAGLILGYLGVVGVVVGSVLYAIIVHDWGRF